MANQKRIEFQQNSFKSGVISPRFWGNIQSKEYAEGAETIQNGIVLSSGGVVSRGGFTLYGSIPNYTEAIRVIPIKIDNVFYFVIIDENIIEVRETYATYEASPLLSAYSDWGSDAIKNMTFAIEGGTIWMASKGYPPKVLSYNPSLGTFSFGNYTISSWAAEFTPNITSGASYYPGVVGIYEGRLVFGNSPAYPLYYWGSDAGDYNSFTLTTPITDANAYEKRVNVKGATKILWFLNTGALFAGTDAGIAVLSPQDELLTSLTSSFTRLASAFGSAAFQGFIMGGEVFFVPRNEKQIRVARYSSEGDTYLTPDITYRAEHLFSAGIKRIVYQQDPESLLWVLLNDGSLLSMNYDPGYEVYAWSSHSFPVPIDDICVLTLNKEDRLVLFAKHDISSEYGALDNGYVLISDGFLKETHEEMNFLDFSVKIDMGDPHVVEFMADPLDPQLSFYCGTFNFPNHSKVRIFFTDDEDNYGVNGNVYEITKTSDYSGVLWNIGSTGPDYLVSEGFSGIRPGTMQLVNNVFGDYLFLEGFNVAAYADFSDGGDCVVEGGQITLDDYASKVIIGVPYNYVISALPPANVKWRNTRITSVKIDRYITCGGESGPANGPMTKLPTSTIPVLNSPPPLESGVIPVYTPTGSGYMKSVQIRQDRPLPMWVRSMVFEMEAGE